MPKKREILDTGNVIQGRLDPYIYSFTTGSVPDYLKVGDTYRSVEVRLKEWKKVFPNLECQYSHVAKTKNGKYFRDYAVHTYLDELGLSRLTREEVDARYFSREFFKQANEQHIKDAISDIDKASKTVSSKYKFFDKNRLPEDLHYKRNMNFDPRPNQKNAIEKFKLAIANNRKHLLMYAVMRFGKTFTSLCCADEMQASFILVVSAKVGVRDEWKKAVESHERFKDYVFIDSTTLLREPLAITTNINNGKRVVAFLSLQDLNGPTIKEKHKDLFQKRIDLLIVDETHFGARAEAYGRVLAAAGLKDKQIEKELTAIARGLEELDSGVTEFKKFAEVDVVLHLSGTPYRILMTNEFEDRDIIAYCQYSDILEAKHKWEDDFWEKIEQEELNPETECSFQEWDNPYFGFPQMLRFAFNLNQESLELLKDLKDKGCVFNLNELFRPQSISPDKKRTYKKFSHETEVLDLLKIIDGSKFDENVFGFLDYPKIKEGQMCHHIVFVLPFRASCDAMAQLLKENQSAFRNLQSYEIINIAGHNTFSEADDAIIAKINECEKAGKKTIALTVNRMLTGSTVPEWDTMVFLKDTASPQEYDQAIFRLQNRYVQTLVGPDGRMVLDMKPQTILVDFDLNRMYALQEQRTLICNMHEGCRGNDNLRTGIERDLKFSPIIVLNGRELQPVNANSVMDAVRKYSAQRTIMEEALGIPIDNSIVRTEFMQKLLRDIAPINALKNIEMKAHKGGDGSGKNVVGGDVTSNNAPGTQEGGQTAPTIEDIQKRLATYYAYILFFSFLTNDKVASLTDIITSIKSSVDNSRIAKNVGLSLEALEYIQDYISPRVLYQLEYKIQNVNEQSQDSSLAPEERVLYAMRRFGRMSNAEVVTPINIVEQMLALIPKSAFTNTTKILDLASKQGEFAYVLYSKYKDKINLQNIYALPTSKLAYEFTRKAFSLMGLDENHVINDFTTYDLLRQSDYKEYEQKLKDMKFDIVVGNPPYQQTVAKKETANGQKRVSSIFHYFQNLVDSLTQYSCLIYPGGRWLHRSGKGMAEFGLKQITSPSLKNVVFFPDANEVFQDVGISDGLSIVVKDQKKQKKGLRYTYIRKGEEPKEVLISHPSEELFPLNPNDWLIAEKIKKIVSAKCFPYLHDSVLSQKLFGIESDFVEQNQSCVRVYEEGGTFDPSNEIKLLANDKAGKAGKSKWYITNRSEIVNGVQYLDKWKVVVSSANAGSQKRNNQLEVLDNFSAFGRSRVALKTFDTKAEAENFKKYCQSELIRFAFLLTDEALSSLAKLVPDIQNYADNNGVIDFAEDINRQLYDLFELSIEEQTYIYNQILQRSK